ncbi:TetR/AcrR family transcriptional regulator [Novosphingobium mangrovi (ex Hu et al. 2023)]|uniref:TetR/AcrR family transcriptional regulator n=1 Tax=Novosphingobium mangrovi (ex Hu et al. 2023) TaxID=2930094 RepID=A0ABT0AAH7_9SPHN|nr:TetR/AcrR family transcriptional regulator [Novosphingobium mangrovi (ex Hu et al. 2023)]MCJ1960200.1 TetR/AcrR family transcriptional regulator [Novosphingobium mangrovi (ex Hu et al. 2023)]
MTTTSPDTAPARTAASAKGAARREKILRGVIAIIARDGYRQQSLRELAKALEMEAQHVLYYFASREDLLRSVIELWDKDSLANPDRAPDFVQVTGPSLDRYVAAVRRSSAAPGMSYLYLSFAADAVVPTHPGHDFVRARQARVRRDLAEAIRAEQAAGTIAPDIDPPRAARQLSALSNGLQLQALLDPDGADCDPAGEVAAAVARLRAAAR